MNREDFKDYFAFSKKEKRGISVLLFLIILIKLSQFFIPFFYPRSSESVAYFSSAYFAPDSLTFKQEEIANEIEAQQKNNSFKTWPKDSLLQWPRESYSTDNFKHDPRPKHYWTNLNLELNTCDSVALKKINGIGGYTARKIIERREKLGGFHSFSQLLEMKSLKPEVIDSIKMHCIIDPNHIKFIKINELADSTTKFSLFLSSQECKAILAYRRNHGSFEKCSDLDKVLVLTPEKIEKLCPYLSFTREK